MKYTFGIKRVYVVLDIVGILCENVLHSEFNGIWRVSFFYLRIFYYYSLSRLIQLVNIHLVFYFISIYLFLISHAILFFHREKKVDHEYILNYFPLTGMAESCRLAFHLVGVPFTDNLIPFPEWPKYKADGKYCFIYSCTVTRVFVRIFVNKNLWAIWV